MPDSQPIERFTIECKACGSLDVRPEINYGTDSQNKGRTYLSLVCEGCGEREELTERYDE